MRCLQSVAIGLLIAACCVSCESYYAVTDLRTNDLYYTRGNLWLMQRRHGGVEFQDLLTGDQIDLQNARLHQIDAQQLQELLKSQPPTTRKS